MGGWVDNWDGSRSFIDEYGREVTHMTPTQARIYQPPAPKGGVFEGNGLSDEDMKEVMTGPNEATIRHRAETGAISRREREETQREASVREAGLKKTHGHEDGPSELREFMRVHFGGSNESGEE